MTNKNKKMKKDKQALVVIFKITSESQNIYICKQLKNNLSNKKLKIFFFLRAIDST